jgi:hypothetical protein
MLAANFSLPYFLLCFKCLENYPVRCLFFTYSKHKSLVQVYYYKLGRHVSLFIFIAASISLDVVLSVLCKRAILV